MSVGLPGPRVKNDAARYSVASRIGFNERLRVANPASSVETARMFGFSVSELLIIVGAVLLLFGPVLLPKLGRRLSELVVGFRGASHELEASLREPPPPPESLDARVEYDEKPVSDA